MPKREVIVPVGPSIAYVPLTRGKYALIDSFDAEWIGAWNWCAYWAESTKCFYAMRGENKGRKRSIRMHAQIIGIEPNRHITADHIVNGNGLDNRRCNLRVADRRQQSLNRRVAKHCRSGVTGVCQKKGTSRWHAYAYKDKIRIALGSFQTVEQAAQARLQYERSL